MRFLIRVVLLCALSLLVVRSAHAIEGPDDRDARNSVFAEGLGDGLLWSVNYERMFEYGLGARVGFGFVRFSAEAGSGSGSVEASANYFFFPITLNYIGISGEKHALELGLGPTLVYVTGEASGFGMSASGAGMVGYGTVHVGYRRQPRDGGFMLRVGVSGMFGPGLGFSVDDPDAWGIIPWGYLSLGGSF